MSAAGATSSSSAGTTPATATTAEPASTSSTAGESTGGSSSTGFDDGCPDEGIVEIGAVWGVGLEGWELTGRGYETGTCTAFDFVDTSLWLRCQQDGGPSGDVEVELATRGNAVVPDALAAMVGLEDLQLVMDYNPTLSTAADLSLRTSTGQLLVLYSEPRYLGGPPDPVGLDFPGWTDPFQSLTVSDLGCALIPSDSSAGPHTRFALEVTGDDSTTVALFPRQQEAVVAGGHTYEVSLVTAAEFVDPCVDCPLFRFHFSAVRHP